MTLFRLISSSNMTNWMHLLPLLENLSVPRCFKPAHLSGEISYTLHHFCDASEAAYGVASYLRAVDESGPWFLQKVD